MAWLRTHLRRIAIVSAAIAGVAVIVVLVIVAGNWQSGRSEAAFKDACADAGLLQHARLLDDAAASYARIEKVDDDGRCPPLRPLAAEYRQRAVEFAERGDVYVRAGLLEHVPPKFDAHDRVWNRASKALLTSVQLDPYEPTAREDLPQVLQALRAPASKNAANAACEYANRLQVAGLLDQAETMYAKALRSGRNTRCIPSGLANIRLTAGKAHRALLEAQTLAAKGDKSAARKRYLEVLMWDASLTKAQTAIKSLPAPDPRKATRSGFIVVTGKDGLDWLTGALKWLGEHVAVAVVVGIALIPVIWFAMWLLLTCTRSKKLRRGMDWLPPFRRFTRTRTQVASFTPVEHGWSCGSLFAHYLSEPPTKGGKPSGFDIDGFEAASAPTDQVSAASVLAAVPNAGALAAAVTWFGEHAPGRDVRLFGQLLSAGPDRFGLRVVVVGRNGRGKGSRTFWSAQLPGPAYGSGDEDAARAALSILAASWAYEQVDT